MPTHDFASFEAGEYQAFTESTALYEDLTDTLITLYDGFNDEIVELLDEAYGPDYWDGSILTDLPEKPLTRDSWKCELGDIAWYISEIGRAYGFSLDSLVTNDEPVEDPRLETQPVRVLVDGAAPVIDALSSVNVNDKVPDLFSSLQQLWRILELVGSSQGLTIGEIVDANKRKLVERPRKPHTISQKEEGLPPIHKRRRRMWVLTLDTT